MFCMKINLIYFRQEVCMRVNMPMFLVFLRF